MPGCRQTARICSNEFARPLALRERAALRPHPKLRRGRAAYRRRQGALHMAMRAYADGRAPPAEVTGAKDGTPGRASPDRAPKEPLPAVRRPLIQGAAEALT